MAPFDVLRVVPKNASLVHFPVVCVRPDRVDRALLQVVEALLDALVNPRMGLHLDRDEVLPIADGPRTRLGRSGGASLRFSQPRSQCRTELKERPPRNDMIHDIYPYQTRGTAALDS
jgi:hypothetical protein